MEIENLQKLWYILAIGVSGFALLSNVIGLIHKLNKKTKKRKRVPK